MALDFATPYGYDDGMSAFCNHACHKCGKPLDANVGCLLLPLMIWIGIISSILYDQIGRVVTEAISMFR